MPFKSSFFGYVEADIPVNKCVTKVNRFIIIGTTIHKFIDTNWVSYYFSCVSYNLQQTDVFYHQMHEEISVVYGFQVEFFCTTSFWFLFRRKMWSTYASQLLIDIKRN